MGFTGAHVLCTFDVFILALYLLSHGCALLKYLFLQFAVLAGVKPTDQAYKSGKITVCLPLNPDLYTLPDYL